MWVQAGPLATRWRQGTRPARHLLGILTRTHLFFRRLGSCRPQLTSTTQWRVIGLRHAPLVGQLHRVSCHLLPSPLTSRDALGAKVSKLGKLLTRDFILEMFWHCITNITSRRRPRKHNEDWFNPLNHRGTLCTTCFNIPYRHLLFVHALKSHNKQRLDPQTALRSY
jgi:hypothetical protein